MNVKEIIIQKVLESLENGIPAWICPYRRIGRPESIRGRRYNGMNIVMLSRQNYASSKWLTYKNVTEIGGNVLKGEKASMVVAWFSQKYSSEKELPSGDIETIEKTGWALKYYQVFNMCQTSLWNPDETLEEVKILDSLIDEKIEKLSSFVEIKKGVAHIPCYSKELHRIGLPPKAHFEDLDEYYSTVFHEIIHSTMTILDRKLSYETEELVAEIGSSMLCQEFGVIKTIENSVAYCSYWAKHIKESKPALLKALSFADKAVEFIMSWGE